MKKTYLIGHVVSIYDLDLDYLVKLKIKYLVCDLDQTLVSPFSKEPPQRLFDLKKSLDEREIRLIIISNNFESRVSLFTKPLGVDYLSFALKFFSFRVKRWLKKKGYAISDCLFVGDQLTTDGIYVSKLGGKLLLTDPLVKKDNLPTKILRRIDTRKRKKMLSSIGDSEIPLRNREENHVLQKDEIERSDR